MDAQASQETVTHLHVRKLLADVADTTAAARRLRAVLTDAQLAWKPEPGVWNVLECLQHLITLDTLYFPRIQAALRKASREGGDAPYRPSFIAKTFIRYVSPKSTRKVKTLRLFEPPPALTDVTVFARFDEHQAAFSQLIRQADGADLNGNTFSSPATRLLRFTLGEGLTMLVAHQQRHLQQARRLTERPDFPG
jgi:hypothetical protein